MRLPLLLARGTALACADGNHFRRKEKGISLSLSLCSFLFKIFESQEDFTAHMCVCISVDDYDVSGLIVSKPKPKTTT